MSSSLQSAVHEVPQEDHKDNAKSRRKARRALLEKANVLEKPADDTQNTELVSEKLEASNMLAESSTPVHLGKRKASESVQDSEAATTGAKKSKAKLRRLARRAQEREQKGTGQITDDSVPREIEASEPSHDNKDPPTAMKQEEKTQDSLKPTTTPDDSIIVASEQIISEGTSAKINAKARRQARRALERQQQEEGAKTGELDGKQSQKDAAKDTKGKNQNKKKEKTTKTDKPKKGKGKAPQEAKIVLFIGQLPFDATSEDVQKFLQPQTKEANVRLLTDKSTGKSKGMAFVDVKDEETAAKVLSLHHASFKGRRINIERSLFGKVKQRKNVVEELRTEQQRATQEKVGKIIEEFLAKPVTGTLLERSAFDPQVREALGRLDEASIRKILAECVAWIQRTKRISNKSAYIMGMIKRHYHETDAQEKAEEEEAT